MRWRLRLYCGHVLEKRSHFTHTMLRSALMGSMSCDQCGLDPAIVVDGEVIGPVEKAPAAPQGLRAIRTRRATGPRKPTRAQLEAKVRELEAELARLRGS